MQRVTITLDDDLMHDLDRIIAARGYQNRSEAIRDLARSGRNRPLSKWRHAQLRCRAGLCLRSSLPASCRSG